MPHDIIDNGESYLAEAVRPLLSQSVKAHFAVGYFFLNGFKAIAQELEKVQELRLLIGNTSSAQTIEQLAEGHAARQAILAQQRQSDFLTAQQRTKLVADSKRKIRERLERLDQTDEDQALVEYLKVDPAVAKHCLVGELESFCSPTSTQGSKRPLQTTWTVTL